MNDLGAPARRHTASLPSPERTAAFAAALGARLVRGDLILLEGGLGAGKTTFVQGLARGMGVAGAVKSPTYTLVHAHRAGAPGRPGLGHVDLYRMPAGRDLTDLGLDDLLAQGVVAVEWGTRLAGREPWTLLVRLRGPDAGDPADWREVELSARDPRGEELLAYAVEWLRSSDGSA